MANKIRILVAEDEKPLSKAVALKLKSFGFESNAAHDGEEAVNMLKNNKFDLLLLDLIRPGVDGFSVLQQLRANGNNIPVTVLSDLGQEEDIQKVKSLGVENHFVKLDVPIADIVKKV